MEKVEALISDLSECSKIALREYISCFEHKEGLSFRFFSYGSNMNEGKFIEDTRKNGQEFGLLNVKKVVLEDYKRILGNRSKNHGLAFTICNYYKGQVEGICHDIPELGLKAFLKKEGVLLQEPKYELLLVRITDEKYPVLTLKGLKPSSLGDLTCKEKLNVYCYLKASVNGAKRWKVNCSDMLELQTVIEDDLC